MGEEGKIFRLEVVAVDIKFLKGFSVIDFWLATTDVLQQRSA